MKHGYFIIIISILLGTYSTSAQQDPQYTQYMYNTEVINPAYAGNREVLSVGLLLRTQWVGLEGAPKTGTLTVSSPIGLMDNMGLGLSIVSDQIGPAVESNVNVDFSYGVKTSENTKLSFGLKAGVDLLDVDFTKLNIYDPTDPRFQNQIDSKIQPQIGAGLYLNSEKYYVGLSVPNFLTTRHFNRSNIENMSLETTAAERLHYFLIAGYVFDLSENLKFKPATLVKMVSGAPLEWDASANFLLYDKFTIGASYRWSAALSALVGFQATEGLFIGFGYDYQTTDIEAYSDGSYEIMIRFDILNNPDRVVAPRFF